MNFTGIKAIETPESARIYFKDFKAGFVQREMTKES
jgi:hypothetical protein